MIDKTITKKQKLELLKKYLPENIVQHCIQVNKVAVFIGRKFIEQGIAIDIEAVDNASLFHDIARVVDIHNFTEDRFKDYPNPRVKFWKDLREKYKGKNHEIAGAEILRENGLEKEAKLLLKHGYHQIDYLDTWEEKIICYADKRVKHDKIVNLKERLDDLTLRYAKGVLNQKNKEIHQKLFKLEQEIFNKIGINPENVNELNEESLNDK